VLVVDENNRPATGLGAAAFRLRVGGDEARLMGFGGPEEPLLLAIVVDLSTPDEAMRRAVRRSLVRLAAGVATDGGAFLLVRPDSGSGRGRGWSRDPDTLAGALEAGPPASVHLPAMIGSALEAVTACRGRRVLVLVTDGGDIADKTQWKELLLAARSGGVPVLAVGLDHEGLDKATGKHLRDLVQVAGGKVYIERGADVVTLAVEYFADLVRAAYRIETLRPDKVCKLRVTAGGDRLEVLHPAEIR
jgi:hypothetical protein